MRPPPRRRPDPRRARPAIRRGWRAATSRFSALLALLLLVWQTGTTQAGELRLGVEGNYTWNSNFFSATENEDQASSFQFGPSIELSDDEGVFRYEVGFDGAYQAYVDQDGVDAWESRLRARASYDFTERTRIRVTDRFRDISNLRFSRQDIVVADTALDPNQDRYFRNDLDVELFHDLTELVQLRLRGTHRWIDFRQNRDRNDSAAWEAASELRWQATENHALGLGLSYARQDFEEARARFGSTADFVNGFATWTWTVTPEVTFTANGGPAWVRSAEDEDASTTQTLFVGGEQNGEIRRAQLGSCAVDPARGQPVASNCLLTLGSNPASDLGPITSFTLDTTDRVGTREVLTFFGGATLNAVLDDWNLQLAYQRRQSSTTGDALASSLDRISSEIEWAPARHRWSLFVAGSWDRRQTLTDSTRIDFEVVGADPTADAQRSTAAGAAFTRVETNDAVRDNFTLIAGYRYRLDQWLSATLDGRYRRTQVDDSGPSRPGIDTFFVVLTFAYDLAPIVY